MNEPGVLLLEAKSLRDCVEAQVCSHHAFSQGHLCGLLITASPGSLVVHAAWQQPQLIVVQDCPGRQASCIATQCN